MFGSSILDVAIGVMLVYMVLALSCTAFNELLAHIFQLRSKTLESWIMRVLNTPGSLTFSAASFYQHPIIQSIVGISRRVWEHKPSYIAAPVFGNTLVDLAVNAYGQSLIGKAEVLWETLSGSVNNLADLQQKLAAPGNDTVKRFLLAVANEVTDTGQILARLTSLKEQKDQLAALVRAVEKSSLLHDVTSDAQLLFEQIGQDNPAPEAIQARLATLPDGPAKSLLAFVAANGGAIHDQLQKIADTAPAAIYDLVLPADAQSDPLLVNQLRNSIACIPNQMAQKALLDAVNQANGDMRKVRASIEDWYDRSMERVSGWYKRLVQQLTFIVAIVLVLVTNADTLRLAQNLQNSPLLRSQLASAAAQIVANASSTSQVSQQVQAARDSLAPITVTLSAPAGSNQPVTINLGAALPASAQVTGTAPITAIVDSLTALDALQELPLGWADEGHEWQRIVCGDADEGCSIQWPALPGTLLALLGKLLSKLVGLAVSVGAVSLGAPFWFDMLNKFVNVRGSGTKPAPGKTAAKG